MQDLFRQAEILFRDMNPPPRGYNRGGFQGFRAAFDLDDIIRQMERQAQHERDQNRYGAQSSGPRTVVSVSTRTETIILPNGR